MEAGLPATNPVRPPHLGALTIFETDFLRPGATAFGSGLGPAPFTSGRPKCASMRMFNAFIDQLAGHTGNQAGCKECP
jgi:hypothetical protein